MSKHLGDFGTERESLDATFGWLGQEFHVHPDLTDLNLVAFMEQASEIDETDERLAMDLILSQLRGLVHPDDWDEFLALSVAKRQRYLDLMELMKGLMEATAGRPTRRRSDSSSGRRNTKAKSKGSSSSQVIRRLERQGRPDLALTVVQAHDARRTG